MRRGPGICWCELNQQRTIQVSQVGGREGRETTTGKGKRWKFNGEGGGGSPLEEKGKNAEKG